MARTTTRRLAQLATGPKTYTSSVSGSLGTMTGSISRFTSKLVSGTSGTLSGVISTIFGKVLTGTMGAFTSDLSTTLFRIRSAGGKVIMGTIRVVTIAVLGSLKLQVQAPMSAPRNTTTTVLAPTKTENTKVIIADDEQREVVGNPPWR